MWEWFTAPQFRPNSDSGSESLQGPLTDRQLISRCAAGDETAWKRLVKRYSGLVFTTARRCGLDQERASDVLQEVWLELHRSLLRLRDAKALPRWLIVTTQRIARREVELSGGHIPVHDELRAHRRTEADAWFEALEHRQQLEHGLRRLSDRCERMLRMFFFSSGKPSYREVATRLGLAEESVGPLRSRCLDRLRRILERTS